MAIPIAIISNKLMDININAKILMVKGSFWHSFTRKWYGRKWMIKDYDNKRCPNIFLLFTKLIDFIITKAENKLYNMHTSSIEINGISYNTVNPENYIKIVIDIPDKRAKELFGEKQIAHTVQYTINGEIRKKKEIRIIPKSSTVEFWIYGKKGKNNIICGYEYWAKKTNTCDVNKLITLFSVVNNGNYFNDIQTFPISNKKLKITMFENIIKYNTHKINHEMSNISDLLIKDELIETETETKENNINTIIVKNKSNKNAIIGYVVKYEKDILDTSIKNSLDLEHAIKTIKSSDKYTTELANVISSAFILKYFKHFIKLKADKYGFNPSDDSLQLNSYQLRQFFSNIINDCNKYPEIVKLYAINTYLYLQTKIDNASIDVTKYYNEYNNINKLEFGSTHNLSSTGKKNYEKIKQLKDKYYAKEELDKIKRIKDDFITSIEKIKNNQMECENKLMACEDIDIKKISNEENRLMANEDIDAKNIINYDSTEEIPILNVENNDDKPKILLNLLKDIPLITTVPEQIHILEQVAKNSIYTDSESPALEKIISKSEIHPITIKPLTPLSKSEPPRHISDNSSNYSDDGFEIVNT